ncbi:MAG: hypothetical protein D6713_01665 [Deltaproteobacteria bacterium]|nr:MAG: hypothetical protein D6713_01665 [Deltaproteobacteria bacterium]
MRLSRREFIGGIAGGVSGALFTSCGGRFARAQVPEGYRVLGRTGAVVSVVGMGAMQCTDPDVIRHAVSLGINYIDTADCYMGGRNEKIVGRALRGSRDRVFLATKVHNGPEERMVASIERSLSSLGVDHVDLMQLHGVSSRAQVFDERALNVLSRMKKEGKIRFAGVTTHTNQVGVLKAVRESGFFDTVLVAFNYRSPAAVAVEIKRTAEAGMGIIGMKTQAGGQPGLEVPGLTPHQAALRFVVETPGIATTIPGMYTKRMVEENSAVMKMKGRVVSSLHVLLARVAEEEGVCSFCSSCVRECRFGAGGVDVNRVWLYLSSYRDPALARSEGIRARDAVSLCASCPGCTVSCREGIDIARRAAMLKKFIG